MKYKFKPWVKVIIACAVLLITFSVGRCTKDKEVITKTITVPSKKGQFEKRTVSKTVDTLYLTRDIIFKGDTIKVNTANESLIKDYIAATEELDKLRLYASAIKLNKYKEKFEDENIELTVEAETQGQLLSLKPSWKTKEYQKTIEILKPKERIFSINAGAAINFNKDFKIDPSIKLDLVNSNGDILSTQYSMNKTITVGYTINMFNIKK